MDTTKLNEIMQSVESDVSFIDEMMTDIIKDYSGDLDVIMKNIHDEVLVVDYPAIYTIEKYFMELSNILYFTCEKVERLGIYDSMSKAKAQESYNRKYLEVTNPSVGKKPTVGETQAMSENAAMYDRTVNDIYNKAYKVLKAKVEAAETMTSTLSKILSHRMQESQLTTNQVERRILNEDNAF